MRDVTVEILRTILAVVKTSNTQSEQATHTKLVGNADGGKFVEIIQHHNPD
jgi:hypothetical protein